MGCRWYRLRLRLRRQRLIALPDDEGLPVVASFDLEPKVRRSLERPYVPNAEA